MTSLDDGLPWDRELDTVVLPEPVRVAIRSVLERTDQLDYDPAEGAWVCAPHGMPDCRQGDCASLPWSQVVFDPMLGAFESWAQDQRLAVMRPYDESDNPDPEWPDEAFRAYSPSEWPLAELLEIVAVEIPDEALARGPILEMRLMDLIKGPRPRSNTD